MKRTLLKPGLAMTPGDHPASLLKILIITGVFHLFV